MEDPIVLDPKGFDQEAAWSECYTAVEKCGGLEAKDGDVNWRAALSDDPGVVSCPECNTYYWMWGRVQRCAKCGFVYPTDWWPMYSWGAAVARSEKARETRFHAARLSHPYYRFGFENPPDGDVYKSAFNVDWRAVLEPWNVPE